MLSCGIPKDKINEPRTHTNKPPKNKGQVQIQIQVQIQVIQVKYMHYGRPTC